MLRAAQLAILTLIMSSLDAGFTLEHMIRKVAGEWNPVMDYLLFHFGVAAFIAGKSLLTGAALILLVHFYKQKKFARVVLWGAFYAYIALMLYHVGIVVVLY